MELRKKMLWRIPAYGIASGLVWHLLIVLFLHKITCVTLPDGTVTLNPFRGLLLDALILILTVIIARLWVTPKMNRKELTLSCALLTGIYLLGLVLQIVLITVAPDHILLVWTGYLYQWAVVISELVILFLKGSAASVWISLAVACFTPFLFLLFARKAPSCDTLLNQRHL